MLAYYSGMGGSSATTLAGYLGSRVTELEYPVSTFHCTVRPGGDSLASPTKGRWILREVERSLTQCRAETRLKLSLGSGCDLGSEL